MTKEDLKAKTIQLLRTYIEEMVEKIDYAIASGKMDIEGAENNFALPRTLAVALLKDEYIRYEKWLIQVHGNRARKEVENIRIWL